MEVTEQRLETRKVTVEVKPMAWDMRRPDMYIQELFLVGESL